MIYMPYPFQIAQGKDAILMASEFASASRTIRMNSKDKSPAEAWMGWSVGRWEGDTLVVDVTDLIDQTWLDRAGDFHSDALHVTERFSFIDRNTSTTRRRSRIEGVRGRGRSQCEHLPASGQERRGAQ
jgi:hypothetical protein